MLQPSILHAVSASTLGMTITHHLLNSRERLTTYSSLPTLRDNIHKHLEPTQHQWLQLMHFYSHSQTGRSPPRNGAVSAWTTRQPVGISRKTWRKGGITQGSRESHRAKCKNKRSTVDIVARVLGLHKSWYLASNCVAASIGKSVHPCTDCRVA